MQIRPYRPDDAPALASLSANCARSEPDFVLNPLWESSEELVAEFDRFDIAPEEHLLVAEAGDGEVRGLVGFLRQPGAALAGLLCPIVARGERGRGLGGQLLRAAQRLAREKLGIALATAAIGTRNRAGYSLLASQGFRPARQYFLLRRERDDELLPPALPGVDGLELGEATPDDAAAILDLYTACGFEPRDLAEMQASMKDGRHAHAVARQEGRSVAFAELETHWPQRIWVAYVGVDPAARDRGVGSGLLGWALERHFERGVDSALLLLSLANRTALRAYEKVGFRRHRLVDVLEKTL